MKKCKEEPVSYTKLEPARGKPGANSSRQGETSEEDAGQLPADGCRTRVPRGSQSGDGGCGGVCALRTHVATLPRVFNPESRVNPATELLKHRGKKENK